MMGLIVKEGLATLHLQRLRCWIAWEILARIDVQAEYLQGRPVQMHEEEVV